MSSDDVFAIWRYASAAERQAVIDADWQPGLLMPYVATCCGGSCCPWGVALRANRFYAALHRPAPLYPTVTEIVMVLDTRRRLGGDDTRVDLAWQATAFVNAWDSGRIAPADLVAHLRALNAVEVAS